MTRFCPFMKKQASFQDGTLLASDVDEDRVATLHILE